VNGLVEGGKAHFRSREDNQAKRSRRGTGVGEAQTMGNKENKQGNMKSVVSLKEILDRSV
jgi:hypothetical protein